MHACGRPRHTARKNKHTTEQLHGGNERFAAVGTTFTFIHSSGRDWQAKNKKKRKKTLLCRLLHTGCTTPVHVNDIRQKAYCTILSSSPNKINSIHLLPLPQMSTTQLLYFFTKYSQYTLVCFLRKNERPANMSPKSHLVLASSVNAGAAGEGERLHAVVAREL